MNDRDRSKRRRRRESRQTDRRNSADDAGLGDFQGSVDRLERAVQELVDSATEQISGKARALIDETADRLEREVDQRRDRAGRTTGERPPTTGERDSRASRREHRRSRRSRRRGNRNGYTPSRRLSRDTKRQKISGVCAGIARHLGTETWLIRCVAVTGLIFLPHIVLPAYLIATFVIPRADRNIDEERAAMRDDHSSPAPELGPKLSPRRSLRSLDADLTEAELRLRRMETHVTSGQFELQRELNKIEEEASGQNR